MVRPSSQLTVSCVRADAHTHEHMHAKRPHTDGRRSPRAIDEHARVGGPRSPATTSRTPVSSGKSTHAHTPGQAYLQSSRRCADSLLASAYRTRIRCTPMLRNGGRGLLGCYSSALLSSLSPSRSPSAAAYSDKGSGCCVSTADARALPFLSHYSANALTSLHVRELHSLSHSL